MSGSRSSNPWVRYYNGDISGAKAMFDNLIKHEQSPMLISDDAYLDHARFHTEIGMLDVAAESLAKIEQKKSHYVLGEMTPNHCELIIQDPNFYKTILLLESGNIDLAIEMAEKIRNRPGGYPDFTARLLKAHLIAKTNRNMPPIDDLNEFLKTTLIFNDCIYNRSTTHMEFSRYAAERLALIVLVSATYGMTLGFSFGPGNQTIASSIQLLTTKFIKYVPKYLHADLLKLFAGYPGNNLYLDRRNKESLKVTKDTLFNMINGLSNKVEAVSLFAEALTKYRSFLSDILYIPRDNLEPTDSSGTLSKMKRAMLSLINNANAEMQPLLIAALKKVNPNLFKNYESEIKLFGTKKNWFGSFFEKKPEVKPSTNSTLTSNEDDWEMIPADDAAQSTSSHSESSSRAPSMFYSFQDPEGL